MTFQEILDLAVYQSGSMGSDEGLADLENDAKTMLRSYVNEAYNIFTRDFYKPYAIESVALNEGGGFDESALSKPLNEVLAVSETKEGIESGYGARAVYDPLNIDYDPLTAQNIGTPGKTVWIKYSYFYPVLEQTTDQPEIPELYHALLADYATWRYMSTGNADKQNRASFFYGRWLEETAKVNRFGEKAYMTNRFRNLWTR